MQRVVHLSTVHKSNDVRIFLKECCSLASAGYDVTLVARAEADSVKNGVKIVAVKQYDHSRLSRMLLSTYDVFRKARRVRADLYHFHDPELMPVGLLLRLIGASVVYDVHEDTPKQILSKEWIPSVMRTPIASTLGAFEWLSSRFIFSRIVAATPPIAVRFPPKKTTTVQNFPIADELTPTDQTLPMEQRAPHVVYPGGLARVRGVVEMVKAMEHVETPGARLILAGLFTDEGLEEEVRALAGWSRVEYRGFLDRSKIASLLAEVRAGLVPDYDIPNYIDSYPVKMFEYMAAGLPVIASDFPLWRTIIDTERCGLLIDQRDPRAIAKAIDWILNNPQAAEDMGRRGREAVEVKYNWAAEERKLLTMYRNEIELT